MELEGLRCCLLKANHAALLPHKYNAEELKRRFGLHLPEDVVEEILLRLPIESLLICKRVCKLWYNLITHPSFVNKHLRFTVQNSKLSLSSSVSLFLKWTRHELSENDIFGGYRHGLDLSKQVLSLVTISEDIAASSNSNSASGDLLPCVIEQFSLPPVPELEQVDFPKDLVSSHCNGVICFFDRWGKNTVVWCNPALKRLKIFHTPCLLPNFESVAHGFGYDPRANVYKYVKIFSSNYYAGVSRAQLYTLGVDSWREIKIDPVQGKFCYPGSKGVYCRGVYYWLNLGVGYEMILSFDMSEEEFHTIPMPYRAEDIHRRILRIALWNESLVLLLSPQVPQVSLSLEMWVMVDGSIGVEGSTYWRKHLTIGPIANIECPLEFWKHDELLFDTSDGQIVSYNLHTQKLRKLPIPGAIYPGLTSVHLYLKSLLLV